MKRIVVKIGGALLNAPLDELWSGLEELLFGAEVVLVHGGGPQTTEMAIKLDHEPIIVQGRRVTSALDLDILKWVIRGELNVNLVAAAGVAGIRAVGMSGADSRLIQVEKRPLWHLEDQEVDFGHVGDFVQADVTALQALLQAGVLPVVCPPGVDAQGKLYNINAVLIIDDIKSELDDNTFKVFINLLDFLNNQIIFSCIDDHFSSKIESDFRDFKKFHVEQLK